MFLHKTHLHYRAASRLVCSGHVRGRDLGHFFLGKKSSFSQVTCKGHMNSCMLLPCFMPYSALYHTECFFSAVPPHHRKQGYRICKKYSVLKHNIFTSIGSTAYYTPGSSWTSTDFMQLHYPIKIQIQDFQFARNSPKSENPHRTSLLQLAKFIIKNCNCPLSCHQTSAKIKQNPLRGLSTTSLTLTALTTTKCKANC
jgi:hypothetical protein